MRSIKSSSLSTRSFVFLDQQWENQWWRNTRYHNFPAQFFLINWCVMIVLVSLISTIPKSFTVRVMRSTSGDRNLHVTLTREKPWYEHLAERSLGSSTKNGNTSQTYSLDVLFPEPIISLDHHQSSRDDLRVIKPSSETRVSSSVTGLSPLETRCSSLETKLSSRFFERYCE